MRKKRKKIQGTCFHFPLITLDVNESVLSFYKYLFPAYFIILYSEKGIFCEI